MNSLSTSPVRTVVRLLWLAAKLMWIAIRFLFSVGVPKPSQKRIFNIRQRSVWLQESCRSLLRIFNTQVQVNGPLPKTGILVSNHLSYLDILVLGALVPSVFVAKFEVKSWPVFGWLAQLAGTIFINRNRRTDVAQANERIRKILDRDALVTLFPEGTSSDGSTVLPLKSSLLEPAIDQRRSVSLAVLRYDLQDGDPAEEVCYWKDMTFFPHLVNLLGKRRVSAAVHFEEVPLRNANRKELAAELHALMQRCQVQLAQAAAGLRLQGTSSTVEIDSFPRAAYWPIES